ncbi:MAG: hypothetical protein NUV31_07565, partial [Dehalococcoidales bacterium]|nr:hypothetical protein [Dehalococcoidales bacterium]
HGNDHDYYQRYDYSAENKCAHIYSSKLNKLANNEFHHMIKESSYEAGVSHHCFLPGLSILETPAS